MYHFPRLGKIFGALTLMKQNPLLYLVETGWRYAGTYRPAMVVYLLLFIVAQSISLCDPFVMGRLLNTVQTGFEGHGAHGNQTLQAIYFYLGLYLLLKIGFWAFHGPARVIERLVAFNIKANYKAKLFGVVVKLPLQWHREHHSGESLDRINRASNSLSEFFADSFGVFCPLFALIGVEVILFNFLPFAFWMSLATSAVAFLLIFLFDNILYKQYSTLNKFENSVATIVQDYIGNVVSIIALSLHNPVMKKVKRTLEVGMPLVRVNMSLNETKWAATTLLTALMTVIVMSVYAHDVISAGKVIRAGTFVMLIEYLRRIGESFYALATFYGSIVRKAADVHSADPLLAALPQTHRRHRTATLPTGWHRVKVKALHFTYEDEKMRMHHLENINVELVKGRAIALVGRSGSGKSTFLNLLRGMHNADRVEVECDGLKLQQGLKHLASHTTLMSQDPEIFADTIRFNIAFGMEADEEEIMAALRAARFDTVLARLPNGLNTKVTENGVNLSGGEKQRLALARGIYFASNKESDIVLLDEPTSNVDSENERKIYSRLLSMFSEKCVVSSVHKLHILDMFDIIYVFDDGKIVESGDFDALISRRGLLAQLWRNYQADETPALTGTDNLGNLVNLHDRS